MQSSTIPSFFLNFIEDCILRMMFERSTICIYCNDKINSSEFRGNYFTLLKSEINRREGYEMYALLNHFENIQKFMEKDFLVDFIFNVIVPIFEENKKKYLMDVENNQDSRLIASICLKIITENCNDEILLRLLTSERINHIKDCTLIPAMSLNACIILSNGMNLMEHQETIKSLLFANILYLIREINSIYDQIHGNDKNNAEFEILDQQMVIVKENLTDLDILLLNAVHWSIVNDLIAKIPTIKSELIANIRTSFHKNILFMIAYKALNTILLKRNIYNSNIKIQQKIRNDEEIDLSKQLLTDYQRPNNPISIICIDYDLNYEQLIRKSFDSFEISRKFSDKLRNEVKGEEFKSCHLYRLDRQKKQRGDKEMFTNLTIHRDNFLPETFSTEYKPTSHESSYHHSQYWISTLRVSAAFYDSSRSIRDAFVKILNRFIGPEEELKEMHRKNLIRELTGKFGIKYLSSIARNCFDISFRLSSHKLSKLLLILCMSEALEVHTNVVSWLT